MVSKRLFWILKLSLLALAVFFLQQKLSHLDLQELNWQWQSNSPIYLASFLTLWLLNLGFDALAWQAIQSILKPITLGTALIHNLKSYGLAFITPANSGEIAGRYIVQEASEHRKKALFLTFWNHAPKLTAKILVCSLILIILSPSYQVTALGSIIAALIFLASVFTYLRLEKIINLFYEKKLWNRPLSAYIIKGEPRLGLRLKLLLINALRFLIFSAQLALILFAFKPEVISLELFWTIPLFYLLSSIIPSYAGLDFIIKGTLALYFFELIEADALSFTLASTVVWFFNWALPSLVGISSLKRSEMEKLRKRKN